MGVFDFLRKSGGTATEERETVTCGHLLLTPTWDNPGDMGKEDRATGYRCYACGESLGLEQAKALQERNAIAL